MPVISIYDSQNHSTKGGLRDLDVILDDIKSGVYKTKVEEIRLAKYNFKLEEKRVSGLDKITIQNDPLYQKAKARLKDLKGKIHRITVSGKFSDEGRKQEYLQAHSGIIDIDIDGIEEFAELEHLKNRLIQDQYCQACFVTCGGDGLAFLVRIVPEEHERAWEGIKEYLFNNYSISIDITHKNVANTRNVSYDPALYVRDSKAKIFKEYPKQKKAKPEVRNFVYAKTDFELAINEINSRRIDFCGDTYDLYRNIGFSIASKFGESGFDYFDSICQWGAKYNKDKILKDYKYFCKNPNGGITIATFFNRCKELNIETSSPKTKRIATVTSASRKGGKDKETTIKNLVKFEDFKREEVEDIVNQIFDDKIEYQAGDTILDEIEAYIKTNYSLVKNEVNGMLEDNGVELSEEDLNGVYISIKKAYPEADQKWMERIIFSPFIKSYNPIREWFVNNEHLMPDELLEKGEIPSIIHKFWKTVKTDNDKFTFKYGTKWLLSIVYSAFGESSNIELDLTGKMGEGKSHFFIHLLPKGLSKYFLKTKLDSNNQNDDYTSLAQYLLVLMDECAGKTRADEKKHRNLLDMDVFSIRRPYRKNPEKMNKLAVLGGTSNPQNLLNGENRRIVPINVISRDHNGYDAINKDELFMALYWMWKNKYPWKITKEEMPELHQATLLFQTYDIEYECLVKYYDKGVDNVGIEYLTSSEIKMIIESKSNQKLSKLKLENELKKLEFEQIRSEKDGITKNLFKVKFIGETSYQKQIPDVF
jgi:predicted P-loop ATPase